MKKFLAVSVAAAGIVSTVFMGGCAKSLFYKFAVDISSEWTENSTPIIAHITGDTDVYYAVEPSNIENGGLELASGKYNISYINPVNEDGSTYTLRDSEVKKENDTRTIHLSSDFVEAKDVPLEYLDKIYSEVDAIPTDNSGISEEDKNEIKVKLEKVINEKKNATE